MFCLPKVLTRIPVMFLEFLQHYQRSRRGFFAHSLVIFIQTVPSHGEVVRLLEWRLSTDLQIYSRLLAAAALNLVLNGLSFVE
jgi:hypothetical protein